MKYFIFRGVRVSPLSNSSKTENGDPLSPAPGEFNLLRISGVGRISIFINKESDTMILIAARSQQKAYSLALSLRASLSVFLGYQQDTNFETLVELTQKPSVEHAVRDITGLYAQIWPNPVHDSELMLFMGTARILTLDELQWLCRIVEVAHCHQQLALSLLHLDRSNQLVSGFMSGSYYQSQYSSMRQEQSPYARQKLYLEYRTLYDLAFLSGFRSLEALLGASNLRAHEIGNKLGALDVRFGTDFAGSRWRSYHEVFSSRRKWWSYNEIIARYLIVRNAVAAHASPKPKYLLAEDQVLEIQLLAKSMLYNSCISIGDALEDFQD